MKILEKLRNAFKRKDLTPLKRVSNQAIERAALTEDPDLVNISLISYALYKLLSKPHVLESKQWDAFVQDVDNDLTKAIKMHGRNESIGKFLETEIINDITRIDSSLGNYVNDVIEKARVKQASRIYAMGLSADKAIALTGADRFDLLSYIGSTVIHDRPYTRSKSVVDRYQFTKKVLEED